MGMHLKSQGKEIVFDREIEVRHLKKYSFESLLRNDFVIPFLFSLMFLKYRNQSHWYRTRQFSHATIGQVFATGLAIVSLLSVVGTVVTANRILGFGACVLLGVFYFLWKGFLLRVAKTKGIFFFVQTVLFLPLDAAVMFCGMVSGFLFGFSKPLGKGMESLKRERVVERVA